MVHILDFCNHLFVYSGRFLLGQDDQGRPLHQREYFELWHLGRQHSDGYRCVGATDPMAVEVADEAGEEDCHCRYLLAR